jgi:hypothetical protein
MSQGHGNLLQDSMEIFTSALWQAFLWRGFAFVSAPGWINREYKSIQQNREAKHWVSVLVAEHRR